MSVIRHQNHCFLTSKSHLSMLKSKHLMLNSQRSDPSLGSVRVLTLKHQTHTVYLSIESLLFKHPMIPMLRQQTLETHSEQAGHCQGLGWSLSGSRLVTVSYQICCCQSLGLSMSAVMLITSSYYAHPSEQTNANLFFCLPTSLKFNLLSHHSYLNG